MLSMQGMVAKELYEQGALPQKYEDLVPKPLRKNIGSVYYRYTKGNTVYNAKRTELDNSSDYNILSAEASGGAKYLLNATRLGNPCLEDNTKWTMNKNWTLKARVKVNSVEISNKSSGSSYWFVDVFGFSCMVSQDSYWNTLSDGGCGFYLTNGGGTSNKFGYSRANSYAPSAIVTSANLGTVVNIKLENNIRSNILSLAYALNDSEDYTVVVSRGTSRVSGTNSGSKIQCCVQFGSTWSSRGRAYGLECLLRDIELEQEGEMLFQRV